MKNIKILGLLLVGLLVASCGDPDLNFNNFDNVDQGAFARNLGVTGAYSLADIPGSSIDGTVEFYDDNNGKNVASYDWTVEYRSGGATQGSAVSILSLPAAQFSENANGLPQVSFSLRMQDAMTALGLNAADLAAGDEFRFEATITKTDGSTFTSANAGPNTISQPTFQALFRITTPVN